MQQRGFGAGCYMPIQTLIWPCSIFGFDDLWSKDQGLVGDWGPNTVHCSCLVPNNFMFDNCQLYCLCTEQNPQFFIVFRCPKMIDLDLEFFRVFAIGSNAHPMWVLSTNHSFPRWFCTSIWEVYRIPCPKIDIRPCQIRSWKISFRHFLRVKLLIYWRVNTNPYCGWLRNPAPVGRWAKPRYNML